MKTICVVAAVIVRDGADGSRQVLSTQRGYGDWKGWWEFPGGKVEPGESPGAALEREIREELSCKIRVGEYLGTVEYDYPAFHLSMRCYACSLAGGEPELLEHESAAWLPAESLRSVRWLPADLLILDKVAALLAGG
ncbi:MAG: (deoxy)nucleoside triphosphate pyrophosphohydrolase [Treponema sp.]|nr:(deoxy)nucleoside triphosphate pyrophosphohydrolase [Treponema sp.]MBQ6566536.1 (deoxy)nucleoside triphosphate pyrophosphohydrolase [Treponema sp.]